MFNMSLDQMFLLCLLARSSFFFFFLSFNYHFSFFFNFKFYIQRCILRCILILIAWETIFQTVLEVWYNKVKSQLWGTFECLKSMGGTAERKWGSVHIHTRKVCFLLKVSNFTICPSEKKNAMGCSFGNDRSPPSDPVWSIERKGIDKIRHKKWYHAILSCTHRQTDWQKHILCHNLMM